MTYIVYAFLGGHWTRILATRSLEYAEAFRAEITGIKTKIEIRKRK